MRKTVLMAGMLALAGCVPPPHLEEQPQGVGFRTLAEYQAEREALRQQQLAEEAELQASQTVLPPEREPEPEVPVTEDDQQAADAMEALASLDEPVEETALPAAPVEEPETQTQTQPRSNAGISDEQDFDAVSSRESIQSDAERIAANRELYVIVQPTDLPQRPGNLGPNVVDFALATNNPLGTQLYSRTGMTSMNRFNRNCARYASSDLAQQDFLANGGPERDRMGIDPDGDGFACYWDPTPFRNARGQ